MLGQDLGTQQARRELPFSPTMPLKHQEPGLANPSPAVWMSSLPFDPGWIRPLRLNDAPTAQATEGGAARGKHCKTTVSVPYTGVLQLNFQWK